MRAIDDGDVSDTAQMVKLVDTPASGAGGRKAVEVRVFFWAPIQNLRASLSSLTKTRESGFLRFRPLIFPRAIAFLRIRKAHMRNDIVYDCYKFLRHYSEETCE